MQTHVDSKRLARLAEAVEAGKFKLPIAKRFLLAQAASAQQFAEVGYQQGPAQGLILHATHQVTIQDGAKSKHQDRDRSRQTTQTSSRNWLRDPA
jgi:hypothetical protein